MYHLQIKLIRRTICIIAVLCSSYVIYAQQNISPVLKGINRIILNHLPKESTDEGFSDSRDTISFFVRNDTVMYRIPYRYLPEAYQTSPTEVRILKTEIRYQYFVYKEGTKAGVWLGSEPNVFRPKSKDVQSFLLQYRDGYEGTIDMLMEVKPTLVSKQEIGEETILKYVPKEKAAKPGLDTTIITLSNRFSDIPYHYSTKADAYYKKRVIGMKLKIDVGKSSAPSRQQLFMEITGYLSPILPHQLQEAKKYLEMATQMNQ